MTVRALIGSLTCPLVTLASLSPCHAMLIGIGFDITDSPVFSISESTGTGSSLGNSGVPRLNGISANSSNTLFAASNNSLYTINPTTGAGSLATPLPAGVLVQSLAFSNTDSLFAIRNGPGVDILATIDTTTGITTDVGSMTGFTLVQGLDFDPMTGTLYGWDINAGLVTIDPATGVTTDVDTTVGPGGVNIQSIVFAPDGTLYGARDELYTIDLTTGASTLVGSGGFSDVRGIEYVADPTTVDPASGIPEPGTAVLSAGWLAVLGCVLKRRQTRPSSGTV